MHIRSDKTWDLSQPVSHDGPGWPEFDPPVIRHRYRREVEGFNAETIEMNVHTGTHVDVPFHFDDAGATIDRVPLDAFAGPALFMDLCELVEPASEIGPEQLEPGLDQLHEGGRAS
jgi:kynurenine formamidase